MSYEEWATYGLATELKNFLPLLGSTGKQKLSAAFKADREVESIFETYRPDNLIQPLQISSECYFSSKDSFPDKQYIAIIYGMEFALSSMTINEIKKRYPEMTWRWIEWIEGG